MTNALNTDTVYPAGEALSTGNNTSSADRTCPEDTTLSTGGNILNADTARFEDAALSIKKNILRLALQGGSNGAHIAPALSMAEIMAVLYMSRIRIGKTAAESDVFILSKGHGALAYYAALKEAGHISEEQLLDFEVNGSALPGQPSKNERLHIDYSGGSLGMGLSYAIGIAEGIRNKAGDKAEGAGNAANETLEGVRNVASDRKVYVLLGDGESDEGTVWESAMFAAHRKLSAITVIVDRNAMQSDGFSSEILGYDAEKIWSAYGWHVVSCDGHDVDSLNAAFDEPAGSAQSGAPKVIIANTVKGHGVSFMENDPAWHHSKLNEATFEAAMEELDVVRSGDSAMDKLEGAVVSGSDMNKSDRESSNDPIVGSSKDPTISESAGELSDSSKGVMR